MTLSSNGYMENDVVK